MLPKGDRERWLASSSLTSQLQLPLQLGTEPPRKSSTRRQRCARLKAYPAGEGMQSTEKWGGILRKQKVRTTSIYRAARRRLPTPSSLRFCYSLSVGRGPGRFEGMVKMRSCSGPEARWSAPSLGRCTRETAAGSGEHSAVRAGQRQQIKQPTLPHVCGLTDGREGSWTTQSAWLAPSPATTVMYHFTDNGSSSWVCFFWQLNFFFLLFFVFIFYFFFLESIKKNLQLLKKILSL